MVSGLEYAHETELAQAPENSEYETDRDATAIATDDTPPSANQDSATSTTLSPNLPLYSEIPDMGFVVNNNVPSDLLGNLLAVNIGSLLDMSGDKREGFLDYKGPLALHYLEALQTVSLEAKHWARPQLTDFSGWTRIHVITNARGACIS